MLVDDLFFYAYCELYLGLVRDSAKAASRLAWLLGAPDVDRLPYGAPR